MPTVPEAHSTPSRRHLRSRLPIDVPGGDVCHDIVGMTLPGRFRAKFPFQPKGIIHHRLATEKDLQRPITEPPGFDGVRIGRRQMAVAIECLQKQFGPPTDKDVLRR